MVSQAFNLSTQDTGRVGSLFQASLVYMRSSKATQTQVSKKKKPLNIDFWPHLKNKNLSWGVAASAFKEARGSL